MFDEYHFITKVESVQNKDVSGWSIGFILPRTLNGVPFDAEYDCYRVAPTASSLLLSSGVFPIGYNEDLESCYSNYIFLVRFRVGNIKAKSSRRLGMEIQIIDFITWSEYYELRTSSWGLDFAQCNYASSPRVVRRVNDTSCSTCDSYGHYVCDDYYNSEVFLNCQDYGVKHNYANGLVHLEDSRGVYVYSYSNNTVIIAQDTNNSTISCYGNDSHQIITRSNAKVISRGLNSCCLIACLYTSVLHMNDNSHIFENSRLNYMVSLGNNSRIFSHGVGSYVETRGDYSISCSLGMRLVTIAYGTGSWLILAEHEENGRPINVRTGLVGIDIEAGVYYKLVNNEFVEVPIDCTEYTA